MRVQPVSNFSYMNCAVNSNASIQNSKQNAAVCSNDFLADKFCNRAFINPISFGGSQKEKSLPLGEQISAVMGFMGKDDILLVGKDFETAAGDLTEASYSLPNVFLRVFYLEDKNLDTSFIINFDTQGPVEGFDEEEGEEPEDGDFLMPKTHNFIDGTAYIQNIGKGNLEHLYYGYGSTLAPDGYMTLFDKAQFTSGGNPPFTIDTRMGCNPEKYGKSNVRVIDLAPLTQSQISRINKNNAQALRNGEIEAAAELIESSPSQACVKSPMFKDVGGQKSAIEELKKGIVFPIKYPDAFREVNHGFILEGGPGTGKSLLARALANEAGAYYVEIDGSEMESKWVGETEKNWRNLFSGAREFQPSIIFIDEFDSVSKTRAGSSTSRHDDKTVNTILKLMSDIEKNGDEIFVIAATNNKELIDPAMLRSGRFGKHIEVPNPDREGCREIFDIYAKKQNIDEKLDRDKFAGTLYQNGVSGADIMAIVQEAKNNSFVRAGIFERMEKGTYKPGDASKVTIEEVDLNKALLEVTKNKKKDKKSKIGFSMSASQ